MTSGAGPDDNEQRRYVVFEAEGVEADRDAAYLRLMNLVGLDYAQDWYDELLRAIAGLREFPGPLSHAIDERVSVRYGYEVRRMLYYGPRGRRSRTPYRILFTILPAGPDEDEAVIRVLRVLHGAQEMRGPGQETQDEETGPG